MRYGQIIIYCFVSNHPDKISPIIFCFENRLSEKMNYEAASTRIRINKEVTCKKNWYIYAAVSLTRIDDWLLIEIDFGTGPRVLWRRKGQRGKKTDVSGETGGKRIQIGPSERCPDEDLKLSNFISVQVGAGLLGIETTMQFTPTMHFTPIPTNDCLQLLLLAYRFQPYNVSRTHTHTRTHICTRQPPPTVTSITVSKFLTRVPAHPIFNANHSMTFYGVRSPNRPTSTSIREAASHRGSTACCRRSAIVSRIASINHVSREKTSTA